MGMDIVYIQDAPQYVRGHLGGGYRGSHIQKYWDAVKRTHRLAPLIWYTSADSSGNEHRLNTIRPTIPQGHFGLF